MGLDAATAVEVAAVVALAVLIVAIVAASAGACAGGRAAVHDVGLAELGEATTLAMTYEQAARAAGAARRGRASEGREEQPRERCALCLSEFAAAGELVRVVPACGHFFHAECGVDGWLRKRGTCPLCRSGVRPLPLPRPARPECPPLPARARVAGYAVSSP